MRVVCFWWVVVGIYQEGNEGTFLSDDNALYLDKNLDYTGVCIFQNPANMHLGFVNVIA